MSEWQFDKRVSVGNLITLIPIMAALIVFLMSMDKRIDLTSERVTNNRDRISRIEKNIEGQLADIKHSLDRLEDRITTQTTR